MLKHRGVFMQMLFDPFGPQVPAWMRWIQEHNPLTDIPGGPGVLACAVAVILVLHLNRRFKTIDQMEYMKGSPGSQVYVTEILFLSAGGVGLTIWQAVVTAAPFVMYRWVDFAEPYAAGITIILWLCGLVALLPAKMALSDWCILEGSKRVPATLGWAVISCVHVLLFMNIANSLNFISWSVLIIAVWTLTSLLICLWLIVLGVTIMRRERATN